MIDQLKEIAAFLKAKGMVAPELGIVLGTGLGRLANEIEAEVEIAYSDIPHFPIATVEFHSGKLIYGNLKGKKVLAMNGRFHFYEGYDMKQVTMPIRVMKLMGVERLILSNAAGAISLDRMHKGELMLIDDHINLLPENPLHGPNMAEFGPRFPDMSKAYHPEMKAQLVELAKTMDIVLHKGIYASVPGPMLETAAEYRYISRMGADAVGMSTVPEVIVANQMGLPCVAISVLTDDCDPDNLQPVAIEEIIAIAGKAEVKLTELLLAFIAQLN